MLVDSWKHRVAKIDGQWRMYCPERGTESLIFAPDFHYVQVLMYTPCPHLDDQNWPLLS